MAVGADPQSRSVPVKKLQAGAPLVAKAEEMAAQRIRLKKPLGQSKGPTPLLFRQPGAAET